MAVKANITESDHLFIGEDKSIDFLITENGVPVDCSSWEITWSLARNKADAALLKKSGTDITFSNGNGTNDKVSVALADVDTDGLLPGWYTHGLWRIDDGAELVLSYGKVYLGKVVV